MAEKKVQKTMETAAVTAAEKTAKKAVKKTVKKAEPKVAMFIQYAGKEVDTAELLKAAKKDFVKKAGKAAGKKASDIKKIELYIKPEEDAVYYVIDGEVSDEYKFDF